MIETEKKKFTSSKPVLSETPKSEKTPTAEGGKDPQKEPVPSEAEKTDLQISEKADKRIILELINGKWEAKFTCYKGYFSVIDLSRISNAIRFHFRLYQRQLKLAEKIERKD